MKNYSYPLDDTWTAQEMADVVAFFNVVETAYESRISVKEFLEAYQTFKAIVPSKAQEKQLDRAFEKVSGYSSYRAIQMAKTSDKGVISLGK